MKIILLLLALVSGVCSAQTFQVNNLTVNGNQTTTGTSSFTGQSTFTLSPTIPTPATGDNSTKGATTAFISAIPGCKSVINYGGDNTGTNDNTTAFLSAISASPSGKACVYFPPGTYIFSGNVSYLLPSTTAQLTIIGVGAGQSILKWAGGGGLSITMPGGSGNAVHIRDLSFLTGSAGGGNPAINLVNATNTVGPQPTEWSDISNVSIHGSDGYGATNYWATGINVSSWSEINFINDTIVASGNGGSLAGYSGQGVGIFLAGNTGTSAPPPAVGYNIQNSQLNYVGTAIDIGTEVQGITVTNTGITGGKVGIYCPFGQTADDQLILTGSQINVSDQALNLNNMGDTLLSANLFLGPQNSTIAQLNNVGVLSVVGNSFHAISTTGTNGLVISSTTLHYPSTISGNTFLNFGGTAVILQAGSNNVNVQSNSYSGNTFNTNNASGAACPATSTANCLGTSSTP